MRILLVDDSVALRETIAVEMALFDWQVLQAGSGADALEIVAKERFKLDAIILDQMMPGMDGLTVFPKIQKLDSEVPVIMMTSYGSIVLVTEFMKLGGAGFLEKPIVHFELLKVRIEEAVRSNRLKKDLEKSRLAREAAEVIYEAKDNFLVNMSHELRTPLTHLLHFADMANKRFKQGKIKEGMDMLERWVVGRERLFRTVANIEWMAQLHTGVLVHRVREEDLVSLVASVVQQLEKVAQEKKVRIQLDGIDKRVLRLDDTQIRRALLEIIDNAVRFSPVEGVVLVTVTTSETIDCVTVCDSGPGFKEGEEGLVLTPFNKGCSTPSIPSMGLGLGLSIASAVVERHGGSVLVANKKNESGAQITLTIPFYG